MNQQELEQCKRFKEIRLALNMKQGQLAKELTLSQGHVSDIENGRKAVSDQTIEILSLKYGVNEEWIRNGHPPMLIVQKRENQLMSWAANILKDESDSFKRRFVNMLMSLTEDEWEFIERKAKELAGVDDKKADG